MPTKRKPSGLESNAFFGVPHAAIAFKRVKLDEVAVQELRALGFTDEHIDRMEKVAGRFAGSRALLKDRATAEREARAQLRDGLRLPKDDEAALVAWVRRLNLLSRLTVGGCVRHGHDAVARLRAAGGPDDMRPNPRYVRAVRRAIPAAVRLPVPKGRPEDDALRSLVWGVANLWRTVIGELPGYSSDGMGETPRDREAGPFARTVRACMKAANADTAHSVEHLLREVASARKNP